MAVHEDVRAGHPARVDDRGVVEFVREDRVAAPHECGYRADIRHIARRVDDRRLRSLERGEVALEFGVRNLRAGREARSAGTRAPEPGGARRGGCDACVAREVEVVVRGEDDEFTSIDGSRRTSRRFERAAAAEEALRTARGEVRGKGFEPGGGVGVRREHGHVLDEDGGALEVFDCLRDAPAWSAVEEYASAARVAFLLDRRDAPVAEALRGDVSRDVVRIVRDAYLRDYSGRVLYFRGEHYGLGVVVLSARRSLFEGGGVVHVRRPHAARAVRLEPLQGVRVEQHRPAHRVRFREERHDLSYARDAVFGEEGRREGESLLRGVGGVCPDGKGLYAPYFARLRLDLDVEEVGLALRMRERARGEKGGDGWNGRCGHDLLRARSVLARARGAHLDGIETGRLFLHWAIWYHKWHQSASRGVA